jgi:hypothetical protein
MPVNNFYNLGREEERESIRKQFRYRQNLRNKISGYWQDLNDNSDLGSEYKMLNVIYKQELTEIYKEKIQELEEILDNIEASLFDITEGQF